MRARHSSSSFLVTLAWLAATGLAGGCTTAVFEPEPVGQGDASEDSASADGEPSSAVSPNRTVPEEEEAPESQPELAPNEPAPNEPELPKEEEIPAASNLVVPDAADYLPPIDGLTSFSVEGLTAEGSTLTTSLIPGGICVEGTSTLLYDDAGNPDYDSSWGASLKIYTGGWRPGDFGVQGLSFDLLGDVPPLRFQGFSKSNTAYCEALSGGASSVLFGDLQEECYSNVEDRARFSEPVLGAFEWLIFSSPAGPKSFDFCIQGLTPTLEDVPPEPGIAPAAGASPEAEADPDAEED